MRRALLLPLAFAAACDSYLTPGFATPTPGEHVWRAYDVVTQAGPPVAYVDSTDGALRAEMAVFAGSGEPLTFVPLGAFESTSTLPSHVANRWYPSPGVDLPYVGKSSVARGSDTGEGVAPDPQGVFDLQLQPSRDALAVIAFIVPTNGRYSIYDVVTRHPEQGCSDGSGVMIFREGFAQAGLSAPGDDAWHAAGQALDAGPMTAGERIFFGVAAVADETCDATELSFTVRRRR